MHKYAVTAKPPEAGGVFNSLIAASVAGRSFGDYNGALSFIRGVDMDNPDAAPRGYSNPEYNAVPRMAALDPSSPLAIALESRHRRDPTGTVGYTHHHVAVEHLSHISAMFARWVTEFNVLYAAASAAQASKNAGQYVRLDSVREARYTDGDVEAFLAAVGPLTDGNIAYPAGKTLDVDIIYQRVMTQLVAELPILDHIGFAIGEGDARRYIGLGTVPKTGQNVCVLSSETYDKLISAPWKRILTIPRVRDMIREQFEQRLTAAAEGHYGPGSNGMISIVEGDDILYLPHQIDGEVITWDTMCAAIDARNPLNTDTTNLGVGSTDVERSGCYNGGGQVLTIDTWLNQFYDKGDLALSILEGDVDVLTPGLHCVLLSSPVVDDAGNIVIGELANNSGCLTTTNLITGDAINVISGAQDMVFLDDYTMSDSDTDGNWQPVSDEHCTTLLPNGLLNIGSCGSAKATSWIRILRHLRLNYPQEAKLLLEKSGRSKKTLPQGVNRIASMDSLLAEVMSNGQRDGYINSPTIAFNVTRLTRDEQDGPIFAGSTVGLNNPSTGSASPIMATEANGWDRVDNSDGRYIVTPNGLTVNFEHGTPSRFSGEWDAGRIATWCTDFTSDSVALGSGSVEVEVTRNLLSYPCADTGAATLQPRYVPWSSGAQTTSSGTYQTMWDWLAQLPNPDVFSTEVSELFEFAGYGGGIALESYHVTRGFVRGLGQRAFGANNIGIGTGYYAPRSVGSIRDSSRRAFLAPTTTITGNVGGTSTTLDVFVNGDFSNIGTEFMNGSVSSHASPMCVWQWDPNRTQMLGTSVHRWTGVYFDSLLPHPYLPHPIAVSTAYCRLSDLIGREDANENPCAVTLIGQPSNLLRGFGYQDSGIILIDRTPFGSEQVGDGAVPGVYVNNPSSSWKGYVSTDVAQDLITGGSSWAPSGIPTADTAEVLPTYEMFSLITNGCNRTPTAHTRLSILWNGNDQASCAVAGQSSFLVYAPWQVEGEVNVCVGDGYGVLTGVCPGSALTIRGKGLLFEGDLYTASFNDVMAWYVATYSGERSLVFSPFPGYWAPYSANNGFISVAAPGVGANYNLTAGQVDTLKPATSSVGVNLVQNDWFRKAADLSSKHARMRSGSLVNPWIRAGGEPGLVHMRYDNSMLGPIFSAMEKQLTDLGYTLTTGLTNSLFLEVQMAN